MSFWRWKICLRKKIGKKILMMKKTKMKNGKNQKIFQILFLNCEATDKNLEIRG
jgi:hypothetical protein